MTQVFVCLLEELLSNSVNFQHLHMMKIDSSSTFECWKNRHFLHFITRVEKIQFSAPLLMKGDRYFRWEKI